jgi:hypothetical protein
MDFCDRDRWVEFRTRTLEAGGGWGGPFLWSAKVVLCVCEESSEDSRNWEPIGRCSTYDEVLSRESFFEYVLISQRKCHELDGSGFISWAL